MTRHTPYVKYLVIDGGAACRFKCRILPDGERQVWDCDGPLNKARIDSAVRKAINRGVFVGCGGSDPYEDLLSILLGEYDGAVIVERNDKAPYEPRVRDETGVLGVIKFVFGVLFVACVMAYMSICEFIESKRAH